MSRISAAPLKLQVITTTEDVEQPTEYSTSTGCEGHAVIHRDKQLRQRLRSCSLCELY